MSISEKQLVANQQNALKGGPKTPEGKAIISMNATKHGILSKSIVINAGMVQESEEEFKELKQSFFEALAPRNKAEEEIIFNIVCAIWRKRRLIFAEAGEIKKRNAYLSDIEDARQLHAEDGNELAYLCFSPEYIFKTKLNNLTQVKKLVGILAYAIDEFEHGYTIYANVHKLLKPHFEGDTDFVTALDSMMIASTPENEPKSNEARLVRLKAKLSKLKERQEYLEDRAEKRKIYASTANYLPSTKTVDRLLKYGASIDKQIKSSLSLLQTLRGNFQEEEESPAPLNS